MQLALRGGGGALTGLLFFFAVIVTVPFAVGPDPVLLARLGPAILWIGALLAGLLGLERLFAGERDDGSLDLLVIADARHWLPVTIAVKCAAHWIGTLLPLVVAAPVFGLILSMDAVSIAACVATLVPGTISIVLIGAVGSAVTVALPRGGVLAAILVLPFLIPVLIFGVSATYGATAEPDPFLAPFLILVALSMFLAVLGPFFAALALRSGGQ